MKTKTSPTKPVRKLSKTVKQTKSTKNTLISSTSSKELKKTLNKFENQILLEKIDTLVKVVSKLDKRIGELEDINLSYLAIIDEMNSTLAILTGEVIQEVEESKETKENLLAFPGEKSGNGNGGLKN